MRALLFFVLLFSFEALADVCICQYPKENARFGSGVKEEVFFYKMGCAAWLLREKGCRREKVIDINKSLEPFLDKVLKPNELIRLAFVGHWTSSRASIKYLKATIEPLVSKYKSPIEIENTACLSMESAKKVQDYLESIESTDDVYVSLEGNQTTSIGLWDEFAVGFKKADLVAYADSRGVDTVYPECREFHKKLCTGFQQNESGYCIDDEGKEKDLICHNVIKRRVKSGTPYLKHKKIKKWLFKEDIQKLVNEPLTKAN